MLYAYCPNETKTIVAAALNREKFNAWFEAAGEELSSERYETSFMDHLSNEEFIGFRTTVFVFEHRNVAEQAKFIEKHELLVGTRTRAIDRHTDMVNYDAPDPYDINDVRTIEEIYNLKQEDKYDKRTDEEKASDAQMKKLMDEARKKGEVSDDSFAPRKEVNAGDDKMYVSDVRTLANTDGSVHDVKILGHKDSTNVVVKPNAQLTVEINGKTLQIPVQWKNTTLHGSVDLVREVFEDKIYGEFDGVKMSVKLDDGTQESEVVFNPLITNIHAKIKYVDPTPPEVKHDANPAEYIFAFDKNNDDVTGDDEEDGAGMFPKGTPTFMLANKAYFDENGHIESKHMTKGAGGPFQLPDHYDEIQEAIIVVEGETEDQVRATLIALGFVESKELGELNKQ